MPLNLVLMGTPDFAVPTFAAVLAAGHRIAAVYTQPPRPAGRGMGERPSPVHAWAERSGLSVRMPLNFRDEGAREAFADLGAEAAVVVAYGLILPQAVLDAPRHGCFNLHASRLPRWRGAAPIQRAIMAGDKATAAAVMRMEAGLDTGPVCREAAVPIAPDMTAGDLHDVLAARGAALMVEALAALEAGTLACTPQVGTGVTYATKLSKSETEIDFARPAIEVHNHIRGLSPFPGAWFATSPELGREERIKVLRSAVVEGEGAPGTTLDDALTIACGSGALRLVEAQRAGKRPMSGAELLRGFAIPRGTLLAKRGHRA